MRYPNAYKSTNEEIMFFKNVFPCGEMYSKTSMTKNFSFK